MSGKSKTYTQGIILENYLGWQSPMSKIKLWGLSLLIGFRCTTLVGSIGKALENIII